MTYSTIGKLKKENESDKKLIEQQTQNIDTLKKQVESLQKQLEEKK